VRKATGRVGKQGYEGLANRSIEELRRRGGKPAIKRKPTY